MTSSEKVHTSAAALILSAARKAGLLDNVAEALCFIDKHPDADCLRRELQDAFADAFDGHICLPDLVVEGFYGEGIGIGPFSATELAPYLQPEK